MTVPARSAEFRIDFVVKPKLVSDSNDFRSFISFFFVSVQQKKTFIPLIKGTKVLNFCGTTQIDGKAAHSSVPTHEPFCNGKG